MPHQRDKEMHAKLIEFYLLFAELKPILERNFTKEELGAQVKKVRQERVINPKMLDDEQAWNALFDKQPMMPVPKAISKMGLDAMIQLLDNISAAIEQHPNATQIQKEIVNHPTLADRVEKIDNVIDKRVEENVKKGRPKF